MTSEFTLLLTLFAVREMMKAQEDAHSLPGMAKIKGQTANVGKEVKHLTLSAVA